jgi:hypothetical protein
MPVTTTSDRRPSSDALYAELDVLNEAIGSLVDVLSDNHPLWDSLSEAEVEGRWAARKIITEAADLLQRHADGTFQEALDAVHAGR